MCPRFAIIYRRKIRRFWAFVDDITDDDHSIFFGVYIQLCEQLLEFVEATVRVPHNDHTTIFVRQMIKKDWLQRDIRDGFVRAML